MTQPALQRPAELTNGKKERWRKLGRGRGGRLGERVGVRKGKRELEGGTLTGAEGGLGAGRRLGRAESYFDNLALYLHPPLLIWAPPLDQPPPPTLSPRDTRQGGGGAVGET